MNLQLIFSVLLLFAFPSGARQTVIEESSAKSQQASKDQASYTQGEGPGREIATLNRQLRRRSTTRNTSSEFLQAEKAWKPFFHEFRTIVRNRDRKGMRKMMSEDYSYPCGPVEIPCGQPEVGINELFRVNGWQNIEELTARGATRLLRKGTSILCHGEAKSLSRVSPGYWTKPTKVPEGSNFAIFGFEGGRWFFVTYSFCEME